MKKKVIVAALAVVACLVLLVSCGSDEPTAEQKKADMDKAMTVFATQITRFNELSPKMDTAIDSYKTKKSSTSQAKQQFESISASYMDIAANIKKVETPKWLSSENRTKFDQMKTQYVEASEAMGSFVGVFVKIVAEDKATQEDTEKMKQYNEIRKDRLVKGLELMTYFANGNWKK